jgi:hypothetical protein
MARGDFTKNQFYRLDLTIWRVYGFALSQIRGCVGKRENMEPMIQRARELAAQGRHPQTIKVLLYMEGYAEPNELLSPELIRELKKIADEARNRSHGR